MPLNSEESANERVAVLSEAFDKIIAPPDPEPAEATSTAEPQAAVESSTPAPQDGATSSSSPERPRDERGRFLKADGTAETKPAATDGPKAAATATEKPAAGSTSATPEPKVEATSSTEILRAPQSWKPAEREAWAKAPREVQEAALRREKEITAKLNEVAETTRAWDTFQSVVRPYEGMIREAGASHPLQVVQNLLQTAQVLKYGTPDQKAQMAARIVNDFGVPIEALDSALAGAPSEAAPQYDPNALVAQVEQRLQQRLQAQAQHMAQQRQEREFADFAAKPEHEFAADVKADMDFIREAANRKGIAMTLEDAYSRAVALDPQISKVLEQRKAAEAAKAQVASMQKAKTAASSIKNQPAAASTAQPEDLRALLSQEWDRKGMGR